MARSIERPDKGALVDHGNRRSLEITYTVPLKDMWCPPPLFIKNSPQSFQGFSFILHTKEIVYKRQGRIQDLSLVGGGGGLNILKNSPGAQPQLKLNLPMDIHLLLGGGLLTTLNEPLGKMLI